MRDDDMQGMEKQGQFLNFGLSLALSLCHTHGAAFAAAFVEEYRIQIDRAARVAARVALSDSVIKPVLH